MVEISVVSQANCMWRTWLNPCSVRYVVGKHDPRAAPATGAETSLDVDRILLDRGLACCHGHLRGLQRPDRNVEVQEVPEVDIGPRRPQVVGVSEL